MDKFLKERFQAKNYDSHKRKPITLVVGWILSLYSWQINNYIL
jgi:hypothetical protein